MASEHSLDMNFVDISHYRNDFPLLKMQMNGKRLAFLDTGASAQKPQAVLDVMDDVYTKGYANIHRGLYELSQNLTKSYEDVRKKVADFINAPSDKTIVFTRNATESVNLVAQSWGRTFLQSGDEIILSEMEHHANIVPWQFLCDEIGIVIKIIPFDDCGELDIDAFERLLSEKTKFLSLIHVSNVLGTINPVKKIIDIAKDFYPEMKVLIDGSQAIVHNAVDVQDMDADFYVFTGHKIYAPTGIGVLYGKEELLNAMPPYQGGGDMIESVSFDYTTYKEAPFKFEAGTPAIVEVIGLGRAIDYVRDIGMDNIRKHEQVLLEYGTKELGKIEGLKIYGSSLEKAGIISFTIEGMHSSDIGMILDQCGVAVRTGHHCCMPLMKKLGVDSTVRASLGLYSNKMDIDQLVEGLHKVESLFS